MILVDTGPLVAGSDTDDRYHQVCKQLLRAATEELLVPATVSAQVCYMIERRAGSKGEADFGPIQPRHIEGFTLLPESL